MELRIENLKFEALNNKLVDFISDTKANVELHIDRKTNKAVGLNVIIKAYTFSVKHSYENDFWDGETSETAINVAMDKKDYSIILADKSYDYIAIM